MALTFPKAAFTNGEPIIGTVILQDTTNVSLGYTFNVPSYREVVVLNERSEKLPLKESARPKSAFEERLRKVANDPKTQWVAPGAEEVFPLRVTDRYDMPGPGNYKVAFRLTVSRMDDPRRDAVVVSATMPVRVLARER
jgi:hypothetical protein